MNAACHSGRRSHTRRIIMESSRSQEYCEVRSTAHRKDMDSTIPIHQAALKASTRLEYTITEGPLSQPSYSTVLHPITKTSQPSRAITSLHEPQRAATRQPASRPEHPQRACKTPASHEPPQAPQGDRKTPAGHCEPPRATRKADPRRRNEPRPGPHTRRGRTNQVEPQTRRSHRTRPQARRVDPRHGRRNPTPLGWTSPAEGAKIGFAVTSMPSTV